MSCQYLSNAVMSQPYSHHKNTGRAEVDAWWAGPAQACESGPIKADLAFWEGVPNKTLSCRHPEKKNLKLFQHPCSCWGFRILLKDTSAGWTLESGNHVFESVKILFTHRAGPALPLHNVLPFLQLEKCQARADSFSYFGLPHILGDSCWVGTCASSS